jgi:hypothetical protein
VTALFSFFVILIGLSAQDTPSTEVHSSEAAATAVAENAVFLPLSLIYDDALVDSVSYRPDWPFALPPDAFSPAVAAAGAWQSVAVTIETTDEESHYTVRRDGNGRLSEFPFYYQGTFFPVTVGVGSADGRIKNITIQIPDDYQNDEGSLADKSGGTGIQADNNGAEAGGDTAGPALIEIEILHYEDADRDARPTVARVKNGEAWYFISFNYLNALTLETWHDVNGLALRVFSLAYRQNRQRSALTESGSEGVAWTETWQYDSAANNTEIATPDAVSSALYRHGKPVYVKHQAATMPDAQELQWDERGVLVRISGMKGEQEIDHRYEYSFDRQSNWIERREIRMTVNFGVLTALPGGIVKREITYQ